MKGWMHLMLLQTQICDQYPFREKLSKNTPSKLVSKVVGYVKNARKA